MWDDFTTYNLLKYSHIFSAFLLFGTGLGSAFYKLMTDRSGILAAQAVTNRQVVLADWLFTTPSAIWQPISGLLLLHELGIDWFEPWVLLSFGLYFLAGACWLPVVWIQIEHEKISSQALATGAPLPERYHRLRRWWFALGWPAFLGLTLAVWLMIAKPDLAVLWDG